jgi:hypothetical protein
MGRRFHVVLLLAVCGIAGVDGARAQGGEPNPLWEPVPTSELENQAGARAFRVSSARLDRLKAAPLLQLLEAAPLDTDAAGPQAWVEIILPVPGLLLPRRYERFRVAESPLIPRELAGNVGTLRTYTGRGIDSPALTTRFSVSERGLSGIVLGPEGTWVIEPVEGDADGPGDPLLPLHVSAFKEDLPQRPRPQFELPGHPPVAPPTPLVPATPTAFDAPAAAAEAPTDLAPRIRTFRLAIVATTEFTTYHRNRAGRDEHGASGLRAGARRSL